MNDKDLIKKYEPILCFDKDEAFLPENIQRFVVKSDLYRKQSYRGFLLIMRGIGSDITAVGNF